MITCNVMEYSVGEVIGGIWFVDLKVGGEEEYTGIYVLSDGREALLIDVGPSSTGEKVLGALKDIGILFDSVRYLLLTHVHLDHGGACGGLIRFFPKATVIVHRRGAFHLVNPDAVLWKSSIKVLGNVAEIYGKPEPVPEERIVSIEDTFYLSLGNLDFEILPTPGHASHHVSIYCRNYRVLFPGDSAGVYVPSLDAMLPNTPPPFKLDKALRSIDAMIAFNPEVIAYTHFGVSREGLYNLSRCRRQLTAWYELIKEMKVRGIGKEDEMLGAIAQSDEDLKRFIAKSERLKGLQRGLRTSLRGLIQLVEDAQ